MIPGWLHALRWQQCVIVGSLVLLVACCPMRGANGFGIVSSRTTKTRSFSSRNLHQMANHDNDFWKSRLESADPLEVRLDATLAACHSLARYLAYDMSLPTKEIPGFEVADIIMLVNTFTSALVLAIIWTAVGLVTRLFETTQEMRNWSRLVLTALVSGPLWLILELLLEWPAVSEVNVPERIIAGTFGLFATMGLGRIVSSLM